MFRKTPGLVPRQPLGVPLTGRGVLIPEVWHRLLRGAALQPDAELLWRGEPVCTWGRGEGVRGQSGQGGWGGGPGTHFVRLDLGDQVFEGWEATQPHDCLSLLHGQALDLGGRSGIQHDLLPPQEVLELSIIGGLPGERRAGLSVLPQCCSSADKGRMGGRGSPNGALELDPG